MRSAEALADPLPSANTQVTSLRGLHSSPKEHLISSRPKGRSTGRGRNEGETDPWLRFLVSRAALKPDQL